MTDSCYQVVKYKKVEFDSLKKEKNMILDKVNTPDDVKKLSISKMNSLADEMRELIIKKVNTIGGHMGSNLGIIEATIAMHYVFNSPVDKVVFDVSHQCYPHKILTGRKEGFTNPDNYMKYTGYTAPEESEHDLFKVGHTSTSVSLACGVAKARDLKGEKFNVITLIGDGSLSGGEALEGLDNAATLKSNFIVIVNDNDMSIAENHGGMYQNLKLLRDTEGKAECNLFKAMGLDYLFVKEGNDVEKLIEAFQKVKDINHPIVVHICTQKGKGYVLAEEHKEQWHWCMPFDKETGKSTVSFDGEDYGSMTAEFLMKKMKEDKTLVGITSATPTVFGFTEDKRKEAGSQFVDVGIAEEHAVALASGIAANGGNPVYGVYSTFIQRTYDQLSQDLCINNNPATILVFAASVYGMNDVTHLGIYDIPMMSNIPNLVYLAPTTKEEYLAMVEWSISQKEHPVAIRVPGGAVISDGKTVTKDFGKLNQYEVIQKGSKVAILALGTFYSLGQEVAKEIAKETGVQPTLINPMYITGTDDKLLEELKAEHQVVITLEDGVLDGGFGEKISRFYGDSDMKVLNYGLKKEFIDRYDVNEVLKENRLTKEQIVEDTMKLC